MRTSALLRSLMFQVYVPMLASSLTVGILIPVLPLYLREEGLSFSAVSVVLGAAGVGAIIGGLPSGSVLARFDDRVLLVGSLVTMAVSTLMLGLTVAVFALIALRFTFGLGFVGLRLSRQTHIATTVVATARGRAMSYIGGTFRIAFLLGPLIGGVLVDLFGFTPTFLICGLTCLLGVPAGGARRRGEPLRRSSSEPAIPLFSALWQHRSVVLRGGVALAAVGTVRHGRYVAVPLIADELGLTPSATGGIIAIGTAADLLLFPVAGHVMDSFGRLRAIVPSFVLVAVGLVVLGTAESATMVALAGAVIGVGNGFGAGSNLTIATDLAPPDAPGQVLSAVATIQDLGTLLGPLIVGVTADHFGLSTATMTLAFVAIFAVVWLIAVVGETRGLHPQVRDAAGA